MQKYYITTPIFYASGKPQLGNSYTTVLSDAIARYKRLQNKEVIFQTGMDEHGQKVQLKAEKQNKSPQEFVDKIAEQVKNTLNCLDISYNRFIRTTNNNHKEKVSKIFEKLYKNGDIYKGKYEGLYCTPCESFFTESQLIDGKCPDCGRKVQKTSEEAYFLKIKKYEKWLKQYILQHEDFIIPTSRRNEMIKFIEQGLEDLCVSRTSFDWGIKVPFDQKHVIYVWLDALTNYITFAGYMENEKEFNKFWPADVHVVGKDILRFHSIYWPVILKALNLPMPKHILAHPFFVDAKGEKMSKSKGNVLFADELTKTINKDAIRYYLLSELGLTNDRNISQELIIEKHNTDLANTLGNLINRTITMSLKYHDGIIYKPKTQTKEDKELINLCQNLYKKVEENMKTFKTKEALNAIFEIYKRCNKYIDETTPWILAKEKENEERLKTVMYNLLEAIRIATIFLGPFLPETSEKILKQLKTNETSIESTKEFGKLKENTKLEKPEILFNRIN